jgi:DUF2075 family protein
MLVALIGHGQEIYLGEEGGLQQWRDAIEKSDVPWTITCSSKLAPSFQSLRIEPDDNLDLDVTLRAHQAEDLHEWVNQLLDGRIEEAASTFGSLRKSGFDAYLTRDISDAKNYARERYRDQPDRRFGLLVSSRANILIKHGIDVSFQASKAFRDGPWYNDDPDSPHSCCQLRLPAREFSAQGLELDMPILGWGEDLQWDGFAWLANVGRRPRARNPIALRLNSYRVLLTRGRDGMVVFVPPERNMDSTADVLAEAGLQTLRA